MKELSIEQKAKAYDEAIERAKNLHKDAIDMGENIRAKQCEIIFPELKESENGEIRESLVAYFAKFKQSDMWDDDFSFGDVLSWLEKQGMSYTKRDVDDAYLEGVTNTKNEIEKQYEETYQIRKDIATFIFNYKGVIKDRVKWMDYLGFNVSFVKKQSYQETLCDKGKKEQPSHSCQDITALGRCIVEHEQKPTDKIEPKFKVGDEIKTKNEAPLTITRIDRFGYWSEDLFICSFENSAKWELVEQKPAWSEEDEKYVKDLVDYFTGGLSLKHTEEDIAKWLKSLRPQNRWKPSEEHIHWLKWVINRLPDTEKANEAEAVLKDLLEQLKKLREE